MLTMRGHQEPLPWQGKLCMALAWWQELGKAVLHWSVYLGGRGQGSGGRHEWNGALQLPHRRLCSRGLTLCCLCPATGAGQQSTAPSSVSRGWGTSGMSRMACPLPWVHPTPLSVTHSLLFRSDREFMANGRCGFKPSQAGGYKCLLPSQPAVAVAFQGSLCSPWFQLFFQSVNSSKPSYISLLVSCLLSWSLAPWILVLGPGHLSCIVSWLPELSLSPSSWLQFLTLTCLLT